MSPSGFQGQHKSKRDLFDNEREALRWVSASPNLSTSQFQITGTILRKSMIDANLSVRESFKKTGFHDFDLQEGGQENKRILPIHILTNNCLSQTKIALYRSNNRSTAGKSGDPKLWISNFKTHFSDIWNGGEMICLAQDGERCLAVNLYTIEKTQTTLDLLGRAFSTP